MYTHYTHMNGHHGHKHISLKHKIHTQKKNWLAGSPLWLPRQRPCVLWPLTFPGQSESWPVPPPAPSRSSTRERSSLWPLSESLWLLTQGHEYPRPLTLGHHHQWPLQHGHYHPWKYCSLLIVLSVLIRSHYPWVVRQGGRVERSGVKLRVHLAGRGHPGPSVGSLAPSGGAPSHTWPGSDQGSTRAPLPLPGPMNGKSKETTTEILEINN